MIGIDTNVLVRYIVQDDVQQARAATHFIEHKLSVKRPGFINPIVLCELVWVLESGYGYARAQIAETLQRLFEIDRFRVQMPALAWRARAAYIAGADFSDGLITHINLASDCTETVSFDRAAKRFAGMSLVSK